MLVEIGNHLWQSTVFGCVMALLALLLKRNQAAVRYRLWLAASVKFLMPFSLLVTLGSQVEWRKPPVEVESKVLAVDRLSDPLSRLDPPQRLQWAPIKPSRLPMILSGIWLCGFLANCFAWWRRWRRIRVALRAAKPVILGWPIRAKSTSSPLEPGVFGVFRPFLLLPEGITQKLTTTQFEAVVEHELSHVQRRDNLAAAIHMLAEALFWFHPLVWWIEARLMKERERACDEAVLRSGVDPQDYAEGILNVAKFYLESPLMFVAGVTGANLTQRIEAIMRNAGATSLGIGRKLALAVTGLAAVAIPFGLGVFNAPEIRAQEMLRGDLAFESITIHSIPPVDGMVRYQPRVIPGLSRLEPTKLGGTLGNEFLMPIGTVKSLIMDAYEIPDKQIAGLPEWAAGREFFAIDATAPGEATPAPEQVRLMLRNLLAIRFHLEAHKATRDVPSYEVRIAEGAAKIRQAPPGDPGTDGWPGSWPGLLSLIRVASRLPVVNRTGFSGRIYAPLWRPESFVPGRFLADVQESLGLTLTPVDVPTEFFVVDHVERPRED